MSLLLESNMSLLDLNAMLEGTNDNLLSFMEKYGFTNIDMDLTNQIIENPSYNTSNSFVTRNYLQGRKLATTSPLEDYNVQDSSFDEGFDDGFDSPN